jgi:hypothetical protein
MINKETGNRLKQQMVDAETGDIVESDQKARGHELKKGEYVEIEKEELVSGILHRPHSRAMTTEGATRSASTMRPLDMRYSSRGATRPRLAFIFAQRAQGMPGARCAR